MRVNALRGLADSAIFLPSLRAAPLVSARGVGQISLRDIQAAKDGKEGAPGQAMIDGVFAAAPLEEVQSARDGAAGALEHLKAIDLAITEKTEAAQSLELDALVKLLTQAHKVVADQLAGREGDSPGDVQGAAEAPAAAPETAAGDGGAQAAKASPPPASAPQAASGSGGGQINGPQDVIKALDT
jgi:type VI secretion system protein ImpA